MVVLLSRCAWCLMRRLIKYHSDSLNSSININERVRICGKELTISPKVFSPKHYRTKVRQVKIVLNIYSIKCEENNKHLAVEKVRLSLTAKLETKYLHLSPTY